MNNEIKFLIKNIPADNDYLADFFKGIESLLNIRFDENLKPFYTNDEIIYEFNDVSDFNINEIDREIDSFFNFKFDIVIDSPLYKFLVLKNNEKLTILANIHHLIFDYSSINKFCEIFNNPQYKSVENDLLGYYDDVDDYLSSYDFKRDSDFWNNYFSDAGNYVKFYNLKSDDYRNIEISFDNEATTKFLNEHDISKFNFFTAIFALYLSRIDRSPGSILKSVVSNDFGLFDKSTYLKIKFFKDYSFLDYLKEIKKVYKLATENTKVDIDNYLNTVFYSYGIYDFTGLSEDVTVLNGENSSLTLNVYENSLNLVYSQDLFSDVYMNHMAENIEFLIKDLIDCPNQLLKDINLLSPNEKDLLSDFCKGKEIEIDDDGVFAKNFRDYALAHPDAIAVDDGVNKVSYGDLEKSSNSVANDLHENYGIGFKDHVALMLPRDYHFPELVLALNKIGAAFVPIDLLLPINRIEYMINIAQIEKIITTRDVANSNNFNIDTILLEDLSYDDEVDVEIIPKGNDLFSIMFTSGTSNIPKGVMILNKQISNLPFIITHFFNISPGEVVGCFLSFSFIASYLIFVTLIYGCCIRIFNEREQKDILLLIKSLKEHPMNSLVLPPSIGVPIYENEDLKLDYLCLVGSKLNELIKKERHTKLVNIYGSTEIIIGVLKVYDLNDISSEKVSIGGPIPNERVYVLDENFNQMPIGVPGEICISSEYISSGYYNDPDLTKKVFVDDPFSDNGKMYRTGDIGFFNFDGEIEIVGREDNQLSVRGFRVESDEILNIMKEFNEFSEIYLDVDHDTLIAFYTINDEVDMEDVTDALKMELPYYMVPSLFIELEKIPLNVNGKIDKGSIKEMLKKQNYSDHIEDEILYIVIQAFKEVLNQDIILIDSDFVEFGGNSLSAMKMQILLKEKTGVTLSSNELIELGNPANIANKIKFNLNLHTTIDVKYTFDGLCPLSESQLNVYFDEMGYEAKTEYNNPFKIEFNHSYSVDEIRNAIKSLLEVYPVLSSRVVNDEGDLYLSFDANPEIKEGSIDEIDEFVQPFELDKYLSRFLIANTENSTVLCMDYHHLIFDGASANVLSEPFLKILQGSKVNSIDDGILRQISFEESILDSDYSKEAQDFFDMMLASRDEVSDLIPSVSFDGEDISDLMPSVSLGDGDISDLKSSNECREIISCLEMDNSKLRDFLQSHSITHNQFFSSVFAYALSRFTGSSKVLFNLLEDGRGHIDLSNSVGMFVRTLPLLLDCKNQSVSSFLRYSADMVNSAMKYDLYPFRVLANEYDLDSSILFQYLPSMIQSDNFSIEELRHDENSDLLFNLYDCNDGRFAVRVFHSNKFSIDFVKSFIDAFSRIALEILDVDLLADINYVCEKDLEFLDSFNQTEKDMDYADILDAFNDNLSKNPDNALVSFKDSSYSYAEGAFIASQISNNLNDLGIESGECVSFLLSRSEWYLFSILGILASGSIFVPLDSSHPDERLRFMVEDTSSKVIIVDDSTYPRAKELFADLTLLNVADINVNGELSQLSVSYNDLACILYTSGTTGLPKGVKNTRKSILNVCAFYNDKYDLDENDVYGLFSGIGFDVTIFVINAVLYSGACLSVVPDEIRLDMHRMNEYFKEQNVSHAFITTQVSKLFMNNVDCSYLDLLLVIGEKLGEFDNSGDYALVDAYGPTEAFAFVTAIENNEKIDYSSVGLIDYNMKSYVLDDELRRVPVGAVGELYLSGDQLADGYLNRPEKTAEAFLDNPFTDNPYDDGYSIMYRTGDMVRILPDGTIGFIGRRDTQVKIRGNRLELGEVEAIIRQLDYVKDLSVQTIQNGDNHELVAYIVCDEKYNDSIKEFISENKPDYMVPSHIINLERIPLNANGKVDKKALLDIGFNDSKTEYIAPRTDVEKDIVNAFENAFNMSKISLLDDFANLGGDSLIAIKLISYLKDYNVTSADIMSLRTPKAIADNITEDTFEWDIYSIDEGCPLNESQLNIYLDVATRMDVDSYFIPFVIPIPKEFDENEIITALNMLFMVHPICSMCINDDYEIPHMVKGRVPSISVMSNADDIEIYKFLADPFDLHDSLCRFLIVKNDDGHVLYSVFHHLIFDERSIHVFKHDFKHILNGGYIDFSNSSFDEERVDLIAYSNEELADLISDSSEESIKFDDSFLKVSAFHTQIKNTEQYKDAQEFYGSMLSDFDSAGQLLEDVLPDGPGFASCDLDFDRDLLEEFLRKNSISEYVFFTSVFSYTLSRFTGSNKVGFCVDDHGRDRFNNFDSIGMYVNTLPLLVDTEDKEISLFVEDMSNLIYNVLRYNYYPYRNLIFDHELDMEILFQFFPAWLNKDDLFYNVDNKIIDNIVDFNMDLIMNVNQKDDGYTLNAQYSSKYSKSTINRFMETYNRVLSQMMCVEKLSDIEYTDSSDLELLDSYNEREMEIIYDDILDAFNDNLAKCPDNKLVSYNDISYTYGEGAFIANEIKKLLNGAGIQSGDFVPFLVPRSEWYPLLNLGILSVGAIYVPLDDIHPDERLKFILNDIDSRVLIVTDDTYERAKALSDDLILINVSNIVKEDIGTLSYLEYEYGDLVSVHYTSGSTGVPKGVLGRRKAITNLCQYYIDNYDLDSNDVYGLHTAIGFDVSIFVIAVSIIAGACLSVIPEDARLNMAKLNDYFISQNITHSFITTQLGKLFMEDVDDAPLDVLFVIGEKLGDVASPENYQLVDSYGPTETFNYVSHISNSQKIHHSSVGYISYNMKSYVLDEELRRVPIGALGELYLSGRQLAQGYLNRDEGTSNAFLDNPFEEIEEYAKMYRTGDMVRVLPDGSLGIIGRKDGQVKVRGNRVELGEVEAVIRDLTFVKDVTVQTIRNGDNYELVAYVVYDDVLPVVKSVKDHVTERKPHYMIPSYVIELDEIPLTVNGKVDKNALPEVEFESLMSDYVPPSTETEKIVVDAFKAVFNLEKIGIYDDFVKLGGDSLKSIRVTTFLSKNNIEFNARSILLERTPYSIAQIIDYVDCDNSCSLIKKGINDQNMFLIPPMTGFSFEYSNLVHSIDFEGNVYAIDDPKFNLSLEEIKSLENHGKYTLDKFYELIKDIFNDGDILVGYSSGGIFSLLLAEKLEKEGKTAKCILIDGLLAFKDVLYTRETLYKDALVHWKHHEFDFIVGIERKGTKFEKFVEITLQNVNIDFKEPRLNSPVLYLSTGELFTIEQINEKLDLISPNNKIKLIESTNHSDILKVDYWKLVPFFNGDF
ncbi:D-alanine--poly(phosphoribitol) ligase subunit DltA [uncultured Methanobrevibacter sp.]|uniref:D-alanine--poly(phosphoribitol) ligase subunit DltA n=1 Tax=uncultured Methanobrevibacter sp. TaxID=253161 RepID=UPI0025EA2E8B|nr:D-alanine--poly(phosphoribitol) ligase subunit DltA [uncultured Methanobrevibacter sp.]